MTALNQQVRTSPAAGGGVIVMGVWCPTCREEVGPLRDGTCSGCNRRVYDEDQLSARDAIAALQTPRPGGPMTATAVATRTCKIENCIAEAEDNAGPYALLCATHKQEARAARASSPPAPRSSRTGGASLADQARKLVPLARNLDKARTQLAVLPDQTAAKAAFDEASRRASASPTADNLSRVGETLKQLQTTAPKRTKLENEVSSAERALGLALQSFVQAARAA